MLFEVAPKPYRPDHKVMSADDVDLELVIFYKPLSLHVSRQVVSYYDDDGAPKDRDSILKWSDELMNNIVAMRWNGGSSTDNADIVETIQQDAELAVEIGTAIAQGKVSDSDRSLFPRGDALGNAGVGA